MLTRKVPKINFFIKTIDHLRSNKHLLPRDCWLTDAPRKNNGYDHGSPGPLNVQPLTAAAKQTNPVTDAGIKHKLICVLVRLGVCFPVLNLTLWPSLKRRKEDSCIYK